MLHLNRHCRVGILQQSQIQQALRLLLVLFLTAAGCEPVAVADDLRIATFSVDITPPLGQPVGQGFIPILETAEHPLLARGIIFRDALESCVVCTLDLMEVHNESYDLLRQAIGDAARVPQSRVALQTLHQHTAPAIDAAGDARSSRAPCRFSSSATKRLGCGLDRFKSGPPVHQAKVW